MSGGREKAIRLLMLTPHPPRLGMHAGGARMFQVLLGLRKLGLGIRLITLADEHDPDQREALAKLRPLVESLSVFDPAQRRGRRDPLFLLPENYRRPELEDCIEKELECSDAMLVEYAQTAHLLDVRRRAPQIVTNHEVQTTTWFEYARRKPWSIDKAADYYRACRALYLERSVLKAADAVVALTEEDRESMRRLLPESDIELIPMGVDLGEMCPSGNSKKQDRLLYVGYYGHEPNRDAARFLAGEIMPKISARLPDARLTLAGSCPGEEIESYRAKNIDVPGWLPDLGEVYAKASVFIAPIRTGRGMRGKMLEAFACGLPVVASHLAAAGLGAEDGKELLLAESADEFAEAVLLLLKDAGLRKEMGVNARKLAENFSWDKIALDYEHLIRRKIADKRKAMKFR